MRKFPPESFGLKGFWECLAGGSAGSLAPFLGVGGFSRRVYPARNYWIGTLQLKALRSERLEPAPLCFGEPASSGGLEATCTS